MEDTVLYGTPSRFTAAAHHNVSFGSAPTPRQRDHQPPAPSPNPRHSVPSTPLQPTYYPQARPPSTPAPPLHDIFVSDFSNDQRANGVQAAAGVSTPRDAAAPEAPKEVPLHQQQAQRALQRQRQKQRQTVQQQAAAAAGVRTPRGSAIDVAQIASLSSLHNASTAKLRNGLRTNTPVGPTGHLLNPAERPQAGASSRKLNPPWRSATRVSNPLLQKSHLDFVEGTLRDDDPVSGISGIGRRCIVKLGNTGESCSGTVAFRGETQFKHGTWVGVVLDRPRGRNDGAVGGIRYFQCPPRHGVFVRDSAISVGEDPDLLPGPPERLLERGRAQQRRLEELQKRSEEYQPPTPQMQLQLQVDYDDDSDSNGRGYRTNKGKKARRRFPSYSPRHEGSVAKQDSPREQRARSRRTKKGKHKKKQRKHREHSSSSSDSESEEAPGSASSASGSSDSRSKKVRRSKSGNRSGRQRRGRSPVTTAALERRDAQQIIDDVYDDVDRSQSLSPARAHEVDVSSDENSQSRSRSSDSDVLSGSSDEQSALESNGVEPHTLEQAGILKKICAGVLRNPRQAVRHFDSADKEGSGVLNVEQAHRALRRLGVFLTMSEMVQLCKVSGVSYNDKIMYSALLALDYASLRETVRNGGPQAKPRSRSRKPYFEPQDGGGSFLGLSPARKPSRRSPVRGESRQDLVNIDGIHTIDPPTHRRSHRGSKVSHKRDKKTRRPSKPKRASKSESSDSNDRVNGSRQQRSDSDSDSDNNSGSDKSNRSSSAPPRANRREMALPNSIDFSSLTRRLAKLRTAVDDVLPSSGSDDDAESQDSDRRIRHRHRPRRRPRRSEKHARYDRYDNDAIGFIDEEDYDKQLEAERLAKAMARRPSSPRALDLYSVNGGLSSSPPLQDHRFDTSPTVAEMRLSPPQRDNLRKRESKVLQALGMSPPQMPLRQSRGQQPSRRPSTRETGLMTSSAIHVTAGEQSSSPVKVAVDAPGWAVQKDAFGGVTVTSPPPAPSNFSHRSAAPPPPREWHEQLATARRRPLPTASLGASRAMRSSPVSFSGHSTIGGRGSRLSGRHTGVGRPPLLNGTARFRPTHSGVVAYY